MRSNKLNLIKMKPLGLVILLQLLLTGSALNSFAQDESAKKSKFTLGIDFIRFNRNWIYYSDLLQPTDGSNYAFDLIPSLFLKLPIKKVSLRFKYEFFKKPYLFEANSIDTYRQVDGNLIEHRISIGLEKNLNDNKFTLFYIIDCGVSFSDFKGLYSYNNIDYTMFSDAFNIKGVTLFLQPGFGVKYKISDRIDLNLESAIWLGEGFDKEDTHDINPGLRFIPRPISLFGLSYKIFNFQ
jgi:hypothetical protein